MGCRYFNAHLKICLVNENYHMWYNFLNWLKKIIHILFAKNEFLFIYIDHQNLEDLFGTSYMIYYIIRYSLVWQSINQKSNKPKIIAYAIIYNICSPSYELSITIDKLKLQQLTYNWSILLIYDLKRDKSGQINGKKLLNAVKLS